MFIGREQELDRLNQMYMSEKLEVAVIYGRRRVGKTTLINEFCKNKQTIFFAALDGTAGLNLEALSAAVTESQNDRALILFRSFSDAFTKIGELAQKERLIFVIDEYPYLAKAEPAISSILQNFLDHPFKETRLFLILCGSSMSFMENQVLGYQSPLYGRRTGQFRIDPFDYADSGKWFPAYTDEEKAIMYGVTGGIPMYLDQFSDDRSVRENLMDGLFNKNALLFEEPANLLKQELREPAMYNAIVQAIASGKSKLSEISSTVGIETGLCVRYIDNLITLGILKKERPVTNPNSRQTIYIIDDFFFRFWYTFVFKNMTAILSGRMKDVYADTVGNNLPHYMGKVFERMCRDYLIFYDRSLPFIPQNAGQWWGGNPKTHKQAQIDLVLTSSDNSSAVIGSCKFRNEPVGTKEWYLMQEYAQAMGGFKEYYYYLFSKSGFTDELKRLQDGEKLRLLSLEELYEI